MKRTLLNIDTTEFPMEYTGLLANAHVYDSSCSPQAKVYFIDRDGGYYLKSAAAGSLGQEALMTRFFHEKGLAAEVLSYRNDGERDWLLTRRLRGEDCIHADYMAEPERLCDLTAGILRSLHELPVAGCPDCMERYLALAETNYRTGCYDSSHFPDSFGYRSADEAWKVFSEGRPAFRADTLIHGDYCLPNILLDNWAFSGFIDLGDAGVADRHIDLFWGAWTLFYNLKTDRYRDRFFDAYGREAVDEDMLRIVAAAEVFR